MSGAAGAPRARIVGTGLIGTSIALALRAAGWPVSLEDPSPTAAALARDLGAGTIDELAPDVLAPDVVVVAAPPDVTGAVVATQLARWPSAVVTDVASVKSSVLATVRSLGGDLRRYVGSHPMAGRERSGAVAARPDLCAGRPWVVVPSPESSAEAVALVVSLARAARGEVVTLGPQEHDAAVAAVSHLPQLMATLTAARLRHEPDDAVALCGQGVRDVTRIAASDPGLWTQILAGNAAGVAALLRAVRTDLDDAVGALEALAAGGDAPGARAVLARLLDDGNHGRARVPGKHGGAPTPYTVVTVVVPDEPGALGRLFAAMGEAGINLEDLHLEHAVGHPVALAEVSVLPGVADRLRTHLGAGGWTIH
ncbi:prephenate dehydrogenase [Arsenicicoccus dermatophilus]|uniref:prephenate dehydrogenase n=1 Tax=Arsenicicoccus dermatophilus TaxID=1076331 RepID=UPI001F4CF8CC|nr:prephenate dehydrogenase [Arsenicicoccus dermatophilus]